MRVYKIQKGMNNPNKFSKNCTNEFKQIFTFSSTTLSINYENKKKIFCLKCMQ